MTDLDTPIDDTILEANPEVESQPVEETPSSSLEVPNELSVGSLVHESEEQSEV